MNALPEFSKKQTPASAEAPAHSPFGGSVAPRVLRCPASVELVKKVPASLRKTSVYADRGTALHAAMVLLLDETSKCSFDDVVGKTFGSYTITDDDVATTLRPAFAYVDELLNTRGAEFFLEARVTFPTVAGAFGTADLIIRIGSTAHVIDFKFGVGVRVLALSPAEDDPDADVINAQLLFYAAAARHSLQEFFVDVEDIILTILQPVSIDVDAEMVSSYKAAARSRRVRNTSTAGHSPCGLRCAATKRRLPAAARRMADSLRSDQG